MSHIIPNIILPNGAKMPIIGLGTYQAEDEEAVATINIALECGYRHIDTATLYQNEAAIGRALSEWIASGKGKREDLFVTTKLPQIGNRASDVEQCLDKSLARLQLNYVDLYLIHNPVGLKGKNDNDVWPVDSDGNSVLDLDTDLESLYKAMENQVDHGKTKAIGISNFNSKQIERIMKTCRIKPANHQIEIHVYHQQKPIREVCEKYGISLCGYSPIAAPYMTKSSSDMPILLEHPTVNAIANRLNRTSAQILIRFLVQQGIPTIPKSANPERIAQNIDVFDFELTSSDMSSLEALDQGGKGRVFHFQDIFKGISRHPEWTFHSPY
ncbi:hypothetical protein SK128_001808 [Halocaridina rubra]|uniref:NADP-dependent oxidoreductase domain-containing protein n=1 Tax=Halocaridina rubra TaxID=373956 RepID=A0AAN9ACH2_HALRR